LWADEDIFWFHPPLAGQKLKNGKTRLNGRAGQDTKLAGRQVRSSQLKD